MCDMTHSSQKKGGKWVLRWHPGKNLWRIRLSNMIHTRDIASHHKTFKNPKHLHDKKNSTYLFRNDEKNCLHKHCIRIPVRKKIVYIFNPK